MLEGIFKKDADEVLRVSADNLEGYIAREETITHFFDEFLRQRKTSQPKSTGKIGGYKAFVIAQA